MNEMMALYRSLIRLEAKQLAEALWRESPPKARRQWVLALLDIAITDQCSVNEERDVGLTVRLAFASRLLDFLERELGVRNWATIAREYMRFSRKALEDGAREIPRNLQADYVIGRTLECFSLTRQRALQVADAERNRYLEALAGGLTGEEFDRAVRVHGGADLLAINNLLSDAQWFQGKVVDAKIAGEFDSWLNISSDLMLGDEVAQLLAEHRGRIQGNR